LPARRFRSSRSGRGQIADKQEADIDSVRAETSYKKSPPHIQSCHRFDLE
jgi:hypothetical protein